MLTVAITTSELRACAGDFAKGNHSRLALLQPSGSRLILILFSVLFHSSIIMFM